jgi:hypothetical protein
MRCEIPVIQISTERRGQSNRLYGPQAAYKISRRAEIDDGSTLPMLVLAFREPYRPSASMLCRNRWLLVYSTNHSCAACIAQCRLFAIGEDAVKVCISSFEVSLTPGPVGLITFEGRPFMNGDNNVCMCCQKQGVLLPTPMKVSFRLPCKTVPEKPRIEAHGRRLILRSLVTALAHLAKGASSADHCDTRVIGGRASIQAKWYVVPRE